MNPEGGQIKQYIRSDEENAQMGQSEAGRFNEGKIRHDLMPPWSMNQIAKVYTYGTQKYDDNNWWKGMKWMKGVFGCILRHIWKWARGEKWDPESGLHHLAHAAWNCIALMEYERNKIGCDDRIPYSLDLMDDPERVRRVNMWKKHAEENTLDKYNGLN